MEMLITLVKERHTKKNSKRMMKSNQKRRSSRAKIKGSNHQMRNSSLTKRSKRTCRWQKRRKGKTPMPNNLNKLLPKVGKRTPPKLRKKRPSGSQQLFRHLTCRASLYSIVLKHSYQ